MTAEDKKTSVHAEIQKLETRISFNKGIAWVFVGAGVLAAIVGFCVFYHDTKDSSLLERLSFYGSYLQGAVGSLWALAGLMFIYVAFLGQKQQLLLQREEMEGQETQFKLQQNSIKRQNFESSFYQMVNLHNQLVTGLRQGTNSGKEYFRNLHSGYAGQYDDFIRRKKMTQGWVAQPTDEDRANVSWVIEFYEEIYRTHEPYLGPYFRNLYHLIKFIKSSEIEPKRQYTSLIRAQLSKPELFFLFYNCLGSEGKGFKPLVEEFGLLEHLGPKTLLVEDHRKLYEPTAFK